MFFFNIEKLVLLKQKRQNTGKTAIFAAKLQKIHVNTWLSRLDSNGL